MVTKYISRKVHSSRQKTVSHFNGNFLCRKEFEEHFFFYIRADHMLEGLCRDQARGRNSLLLESNFSLLLAEFKVYMY